MATTAAQPQPPDRRTQAPRPGAVAETGTEQLPLDAETLADLLGVEAWQFRHLGGPAECWLEVAEVGQQTMPSRLPEKGTLPLDEAGEQIVLSWRRALAGYGGGAIRLSAGGRLYQIDLNRRSFIYDWNGSRVTCTPQGQHRRLEKDDEVVLMTYHARETVGQDVSPREVTLTLKLRAGTTAQQPLERPQS